MFRFATLALLAVASSAPAFEPVTVGGWTFMPGVEARFGLQYGDGINFGLGALDDIGETERTSASLSLEPHLGFEHVAGGGTFFGAVSLVGATNVLDGELSGQFGRSGDSRIDVDEAHAGWRNDLFSIAVGPQVFVVGDGLVIGDGNFDIGAEQGQFWVAPFNAWKNAVIATVERDAMRGDAFWLRSDGGFGDSRLYGFSVERTMAERGRFGAMYINVYDGNALAYDGVEAWNLRALDVAVPGLPALKLYAEVVWQFGQDDDGGGSDNDGLGWYVETAYTLPAVPWTTILTYRYARFSGNDLSTSDNETYRSLFYGFYAREWDTFYQGEIAGEYHLFNSNQVTQFVKLRTFPQPAIALTFYYFQHDLEERNYYGSPVGSRDWADEINAGIEYFRGHDIYLYAGVAWSTPNAAAREIFGQDDFTVVQTWMSFHF
ncbi:MAG: hypothetical protein ACU85U_22810 [Gammaproteobacteria bacterium]|jgi:hypothetical protein